MGHRTELVFLEKDDEYVYFEVFHDNVCHGTIYINRIKPLHEKKQESRFSKLIVPPKQSNEVLIKEGDPLFDLINEEEDLYSRSDTQTQREIQ